MADCPTCGGNIDQLVCDGCARTFRLDEVLLRFPTPDNIAREEQDRLDMAERGVT